MKRFLLLIFASVILTFSVSAQIAITPNTSAQGSTLQVFISGSQNEFSGLSGCNPSLILSHNQYGGDSEIEVPNNSANWQYNSSVGDSGFYATITIQNKEYLGNYDLIIGDDNGVHIKASGSAGLFYGFQTFRQLCPTELEKSVLPKNTKINNCKITTSI